MSFILVGFLLANLQLDLGLWAGYAIKLVGGLFFLGGAYELGGLDEDADRLRAPAGVFCAVCAAAAAGVLLTDGGAKNAASIIGGLMTTAAAGLLFRKLFSLLRAKPDITAHPPEVARLCKAFDRLLAVYAVVLLTDGINRFTEGTAADVTGVIMFYTKIASYVFLLVCALSLNRLRKSYSSAHPIG